MPPLDVCIGESIAYRFEQTIPPAPTRADILFAFDTTGSMGSILYYAKKNALLIMDDLTLLIADIHFGVVDFRDYPIEPFGESDDWPYLLRQPITSSRESVESAIIAMRHAGGGDEPEAYTRALYESYTDSAIAWRSDARRFVVMFGDSVPHDDNLNERITSPPINPGEVWCANVVPCVLDPGRDGVPGTADDLDLQTVLDTMRDHQTTLLFVVGDSGMGSVTTSPYWRQWASWTNVGATRSRSTTPPIYPRRSACPRRSAT